MKNRKIKMAAILLCVVFIFGNLAPMAVSAASGAGNFKKAQSYTGQFADVSKKAWYYGDVVSAYEYGLASGAGSKFNPMGNVTVAEATVFAARVRCIYNGEDLSALASQDGETWYYGALTYLQKAGADLSGFAGRYTAAATRLEVAYLFSYALPEAEFSVKNPLIQAIPDVRTTEEFYPSALMLYRAGITTGSDKYGNFRPTSTTTRCEAVAMLNRLADNSKRKKFIPVLGELTVTPQQPEITRGNMGCLNAIPKGEYNCPLALIWSSDNKAAVTTNVYGFYHGGVLGSAVLTAKTATGETVATKTMTVIPTTIDEKVLGSCINSSIDIESYDADGNQINCSKGTVLDLNGIVATTYDAIRGADSLRVQGTTNFQKVSVSVAYTDTVNNFVLLHIDFTYTVYNNQASHMASYYKNKVAFSTAGSEAGSKLYVLAQSDGIERDSTLGSVLECTVTDTSCRIGDSDMIKLSGIDPFYRILDGAMLLNKYGKLVGILKPNGYGGDDSNIYAIPVAALIGAADLLSLHNEEPQDVGQKTMDKNWYIDTELEPSLVAENVVSLTRGRTMYGSIKNAEDIDCYRLAEKGETELTVNFTTGCAGLFEVTLIDENNNKIADAKRSGNGYKLQYTLGEKTLFLCISEKSSWTSSEYSVSDARYIVYMK